jgi:hypothetical protein
VLGSGCVGAANDTAVKVSRAETATRQKRFMASLPQCT